MAVEKIFGWVKKAYLSSIHQCPTHRGSDPTVPSDTQNVGVSHIGNDACKAVMANFVPENFREIWTKTFLSVNIT